MKVKETFGEYIRHLREAQKMPIRILAAKLDIDPSTLSKIERGERTAQLDIVKVIVDVFNLDFNETKIRYLSDKLAYQIISEENTELILQVAEQEIKYLKSKMQRQGNLNFKGE